MKLPRIVRDIAPAWTPPTATSGWAPRPLMRIRLRAGLAFAAYTVILLLASRFGPGWLLPRGALGTALEGVVTLGPLVIFFWMLWRAELRLKRRVRDRHGSICTHCGYDLGASGPEGVCPECGRPYTVSQLRWRWRGARMLPMPSRDDTLREAMPSDVSDT